MLYASRLLAAAYVNIGYVLLAKEVGWSEGGVYSLYPDRIETNVNTIRWAKRCFEQALLLDRNAFVRGWFGLAFVYELINRPVEAEQAWQMVLKHQVPDRRSELAQIALGLLYIQQENFPAAKELWAGKSAEIAFFLACQGDGYLYVSPERALRYYEYAQALASNDTRIDIRVIWALIRTGQIEQALEHLRTLLQQVSPEEFAQKSAELYATVDEGFIWIFITAADVYHQIGKTDNAEFVLNMAVRIHEAPLTFSPMGAFYCHLGRYQEGIEILSRAKAYGTQYYALQARQRLSLCYCQAGLIEQALREAEELARIAPPDSEFHDWFPFLQQNWQQICSR